MASSISTVGFSELAANLQKVAAWLGRLGIDEPRTRLGHYRRVMQQLTDAHARAHKDGLRALWPSSLVPLFEAEELVSIDHWLSGPDYDGYGRERMRIVASGPSSSTDENTSSGNRARNTAGTPSGRPWPQTFIVIAPASSALRAAGISRWAILPSASWHGIAVFSVLTPIKKPLTINHL